MSVKVMSWVWQNSKHGGSELLLELALADCAHDDGTSIFPSVAHLARKSRMSERAVQYILRKLETSGELLADGEGPKGTRKYRIPMDDDYVELGPKVGVQTLQGANDGQKGVQVVAPDPSGDQPSVNKQRSRIPKNFSLSPAMVVYATSRGISDPHQEMMRFVDYYEAKGAVWLDWVKVWQQWCRRAAQRNESYAHRNSRGENYQEVIPPPFLPK